MVDGMLKDLLFVIFIYFSEHEKIIQLQLRNVFRADFTFGSIYSRSMVKAGFRKESAVSN